jgi:hypothetical protein
MARWSSSVAREEREGAERKKKAHSPAGACATQATEVAQPTQERRLDVATNRRRGEAADPEE